MSSQNRMNAGAEYVVYRIWATLQDDRGIHAESLLTCLGALAGYACRFSARQSAPDVPLLESPLSVWALVSRAVQKLGAPSPDIDEITSYVARTSGADRSGFPRARGGHRSRHPAIVYVRQVWPQILPIVQRFCSRPAQIPVLFGIGLQRAIEQTKDVLHPTIAAGIAMECAVAMSKVVLPEDVYAASSLAAPASAKPMLGPTPATASVPDVMRIARDITSTGRGVPTIARDVTTTGRGITTIARNVATDSLVMRAEPRVFEKRGRRGAAADPSGRANNARWNARAGDGASALVARPSASALVARSFASALVARVPASARIAAIVSVAFVAYFGVTFKPSPPETRVAMLAPAPLTAQPMLAPESDVSSLAQPGEEAQPLPDAGFQPQPVPPPSSPSAEEIEERINAESQAQLDATSDGSAEIIMTDL